jgi:hypothetical protein
MKKELFMKYGVIISAILISLVIFSGCPQPVARQEPTPEASPAAHTDLPVKTIEWEEDADGFRQCYTNDAARYGQGFNHFSYSSEILDTVEIQLKKMSGTSNYGIGFQFCYKDSKNWYMINIDVNGHYCVWRKVDNVLAFYFNDGLGWVSVNKNWPYNSYLNKGFGAVNDIKVQQQTAHNFTVSFNGTEVFTFTDASFTGGSSGCSFDIGNSATEEFPNKPEDIRYKMITTKSISSIYWQDDGNGFTQFYTNDSQYYNHGNLHPLGTSYSPMNSVEMEIKKMSGCQSYGYGMVFCYGDDQNYYQLLLAINGYYRIGKNVDGVWSYYLGGAWVSENGAWPSSANLVTGYGSLNKIKVTRDGTGTFILSFNDAQVATFMDNSFTGGRNGFFYSVASQAREGFPGCPVDIRYKLNSAN